MANQQYRVASLARQLAAHVQACDDAWHVSCVWRSRIGRGPPNGCRMLLAARMRNVTDTRAPAQVQNAERYLQSLDGFSLAVMLGESNPA